MRVGQGLTLPAILLNISDVGHLVLTIANIKISNNMTYSDLNYNMRWNGHSRGMKINFNYT